MRYPILILLFFVPLSLPLNAQGGDDASIYRLAQNYEQASRYEDALRYYNDLYSRQKMNSAYSDGVRRCLTQLKRYDEAVALIGDLLSRNPTNAQLLVYRGGLYYQLALPDSAEADFERAINVNTRNARIYTLISDQCLNNRLYEKAVAYLRRGREAMGAPQMFVFEIARASAMNMDFDAAMDEYIRLLISAPSALNQVQQQITQFSEIPEALESAQRMARENAETYSDNVHIRYLLSWLYMEDRNYPAAKNVYREIDELKNARGMELFRFARRAFNEQVYHVAIETYTEIIERYPGAQYRSQAEFYRAQCIEAVQDEFGMPDELSAAPEGTQYPSSEAVDSYRGAIKRYEYIAETWPGEPVATESLYRIAYLKFHRFQDADGALEILEDISSVRRTRFALADVDILIGDVYLSRGEAQRAIDQFTAVTEFPELNPVLRDEVLFKIARTFYFGGDFDTVMVQLEPLTQRPDADIANDALILAGFIERFRKPGEVPLQRFAKAEYLELQHKDSEAAAQYEDIIAVFTSSDILDYCYLKLGELHQRMGKPAEAAGAYSTLVSERTESIERDRAMFLLAQLYETMPDKERQALELYRGILGEYPNSKYTAPSRARILELQKRDS